MTPELDVEIRAIGLGVLGNDVSENRPLMEFARRLVALGAQHRPEVEQTHVLGVTRANVEVLTLTQKRNAIDAEVVRIECFGEGDALLHAITLQCPRSGAGVQIGPKVVHAFCSTRVPQ